MKLNCCILENETIYTEHLIQLLYNGRITEAVV